MPGDEFIVKKGNVHPDLRIAYGGEGVFRGEIIKVSQPVPGVGEILVRPEMHFEGRVYLKPEQKDLPEALRHLNRFYYLARTTSNMPDFLSVAHTFLDIFQKRLSAPLLIFRIFQENPDLYTHTIWTGLIGETARDTRIFRNLIAFLKTNHSSLPESESIHT